jgi:hypothetical protein
MDTVDSAHFMALASMAEADAGIALFDAKYKYEFWRPITAIRNGDIDGNPATERDATWQPIDATPMHPEYPCATTELAPYDRQEGSLVIAGPEVALTPQAELALNGDPRARQQCGQVWPALGGLRPSRSPVDNHRRHGQRDLGAFLGRERRPGGQGADTAWVRNDADRTRLDP